MRVWIDLANSPHPLLFAPISRRLEREGAEVMVTARDHAQTLQLGRERWPHLEAIGEPSPPGRAAKARSIAARVRDLRSWAGGRSPEVALSHNSYAQIAAARSLRVPAVTAMDYEHQPANHLAFRSAGTILLPELLPEAIVRRQGARAAKVVRYPGFKEQLYLGDFEPDPGLRQELGVESGEQLVVARAAPDGAIYHRGGNPIFAEVLRRLARPEGRRIVVLARHPEQRDAVEALGLPGLIVSKRALDGRRLIAAADLFLGAGGTMSREAALLGTPTASIFSGEPAAVDLELERRGLLRRLGSPDEIEEVELGRSAPLELSSIRTAGRRIEDAFVDAVTAAAAAPSRHR